MAKLPLCEEHVQNRPALLVEAPVVLSERRDDQPIEPSPERLCEVVEVHGTAWLDMVATTMPERSIYPKAGHARLNLPNDPPLPGQLDGGDSIGGEGSDPSNLPKPDPNPPK